MLSDHATKRLVLKRADWLEASALVITRFRGLSLQGVCMISIQVSCPPTLRFELSIELCTFHITKNNMAQENEGKRLENRLKKFTLACAYTLTSPTAFEPDEPYLHQRGLSRLFSRLAFPMASFLFVTEY